MVMKFEPWEADAAGSWDRNIYIYFYVWLLNFPKDTEDESELQGVAERHQEVSNRLLIPEG